MPCPWSTGGYILHRAPTEPPPEPCTPCHLYPSGHPIFRGCRGLRGLQGGSKRGSRGSTGSSQRGPGYRPVPLYSGSMDPITVLSTLAVAVQFTMFLCMLGLSQHFRGDVLIGPVCCCTLLHKCRLAVAHVVHVTDAVTRPPNDSTPIERAVDEAASSSSSPWACRPS